MSHTLAAEPGTLPPLVAGKLEWNWVGNTHAKFVDDQPSGTGRWVQNFVDESENGRTYTVQYRDDLVSGSWQPLATVPATGPSTSSIDTTAALVPRRFYRIATQFP